jgi:hypothetical protein
VITFGTHTSDVQVLRPTCGVSDVEGEAIALPIAASYLDVLDDVTGDGLREVVVGGASDQVALISGVPTGGPATATLHGAGLVPIFGDSEPQVIVDEAGSAGVAGLWSDGVFVLHGPLASDIDLADADTAIDAPLQGGRVAAGDLDGDGLDDLVLDVGGATGRVYPILGPIPAGAFDADVLTPAVTVAGVASLGCDRFAGDPFDVSCGLVLGDFDGDGASDLFVDGAFVSGSALVGVVEAVPFATLDHREPRSDLDLVDDRTLTAGDLDGDGTTDLVTTTDDEGIEWREISTDVVFGPFAGATSIRGSPHVSVLDTYDVAVGDVDGDGVADIVGGTWRRDDAVFVALGGPAGF